MKIIECPRDAMQGLPDFIPTLTKTAYLNALLRVGFDTLDAGSFVSPKAIPQLRDTAEVFRGLEWDNSVTKLLAIVANQRGAEEALAFEEVTYLGFPLSASETFQLRNTNKTIAQALAEVARIQELCLAKNRSLIVYISMGFGNPYGDPYNAEIVQHQVQTLAALGIQIVSLADTVGLAQPEEITYFFSHLIPAFPHLEFGAHLHARPESVRIKMEAAYVAGCRRFDGAVRGFGGCPMAGDALVGNMPTETMLAWLEEKDIALHLNREHFATAWQLAGEVFAQAH